MNELLLYDITSSIASSLMIVVLFDDISKYGGVVYWSVLWSDISLFARLVNLITSVFSQKAAVKRVEIVDPINCLTKIADMINEETGFGGVIYRWRRIKMSNTAQHKKRSFLKTKLGGLVVRLGKGSKKLKKAVPSMVEADRSAKESVIDAASTHREKESQEFTGLEKDRLAGVPKEHDNQEKQDKVIKQFEKLLEEIKQLQHEIDNSPQAEVGPELQITKLMAANEQASPQVIESERAEERRKPRTDKLPVANKPVERKRKRPQRDTKNDVSPRVKKRKARQKLCLKCKKQKARSDFHKDSSCKDGLARWCKECKAKAARKYRTKRTAVKN